jgi:5'-nucleotidase (lipoprotein e(P4) family)
MNRWSRNAVFLALVTCATGCATQSDRAVGRPEMAPASTPSAAPAPVPKELLWYRTSAEMQALYLQAYRVASDRVAGLAAAHSKGTWAVIIDADETVLNNSEWSLRGVINDPQYPKGPWNDWVREERATALPGAKGFIERVRSLGGKVIVVTNRDDAVCEPTRRNFDKIDIHVDGVLCDTDGSGNKNPRFRSVTDGTSSLKLAPLSVVAYVGDNIQDFPDKRQATPGSFDEFGVSLFIMPNPVYGSWDHNVLH